MKKSLTKKVCHYKYLNVKLAKQIFYVKHFLPHCILRPEGCVQLTNFLSILLNQNNANFHGKLLFSRCLQVTQGEMKFILNRENSLRIVLMKVIVSFVTFSVVMSPILNFKLIYIAHHADPESELFYVRSGLLFSTFPARTNCSDCIRTFSY